MKSNYQQDRYWSDYIMQPIAIRDIYNDVWPGSKIIELDKGLPGTLKHTLDIAGADKLIKFKDGTIAFLAQRFRRWESAKGYDDFTIRRYRLGGNKTEYAKIIKAIKDRTLTAGFYAYGLANDKNIGFARFRILDFHKFINDFLNDDVVEATFRNNKDGKTSFLAWPFFKLEKYLIYRSGDFLRKNKINFDKKDFSSPVSRPAKILFISQAHLRPGMNLTKLETLFADYDLHEVEDWQQVSDGDLDLMIEDVKGQKAG